jgi:hypothetical protein
MLIFPLKKQWYEKIKSGEKTIEYREVKDYWTKRFVRFYFENTSKNDPFHIYIQNEFYGYHNPQRGDERVYLYPEEYFVFYIKELGSNFDWNQIKLRLGYTQKYLTARITKIEIVNGKDTDLAIDKPVYAIHLNNVKEVLNKREEEND